MRIKSNYFLCGILLMLLMTTAVDAQITSVRNYIFGHSLIDHRPPLYPTPSDETTVPHWVALLAAEAGYDYAVSGQYGFLPQHANLTPFSQWGYDIVDAAWESDLETFAEADFNTVLLTAGNFIQYQGPDVAYYNDPDMTPISATQDITDWLNNQEAGIRIFIYENWPDMAGYLGNGVFPPNETEFAAYNDYLLGDFHDWWLEYHDALIATRADQDIRMIPVGPILAELLDDGLLSEIDIETLYEDDAPHGRPTIYFLAGLVSYMAMYEERAPLTFEVPSIIDSEVANQYEAVVNFIWDALQNFTTEAGESRVFSPETTLPVVIEYLSVQEVGAVVQVDWGVALDASGITFTVEHAVDGIDFKAIGEISRTTISPQQTDFTLQHPKPFPGQHYYRLKQTDPDGTYTYSPVRILEIIGALSPKYILYPNPAKAGHLKLRISEEAMSDVELDLSIFDAFGRIVYSKRINGTEAEQTLISIEDYSAGIYQVVIQQGYERYTTLITLLRE